MSEDEPKPDRKRWNLNIHYQREVIEQVPETARTALDVGCGEGLFARTLAKRGLDVTGIDEDADSIRRARAQDTSRIAYVEADVLTADLPRESFDVVASIAALHHMDIVAGLERLKELTAPGGTVIVVGLAKATWRDIPREMVASVADKLQRLFRGYWDHGSPCAWPPPHTYEDVKREAARLMPGSVFAKKLLWRYTLVWTKPAAAQGAIED
ncbi:class I SAM-dependent methyltransferase [Demequina sp. SO4-18]|uniref:class I SAM-dependent methyltransferase n=1 Tax=Demequina sp. SO4-18 TaxID=3401026 RepID=UPI003B5BA225